jgi:hypothetical protein
MWHSNATTAHADGADEGGHRHGDGTHHSHSHGPESGIGSPAASASVALNIGGGMGALIILPSERFRDQEIEISRIGGKGPRVHTGVHERGSAAGSMLTAIFGSLPTGQYVIWEDASTAGPVIEINDGAVSQVELN